MLVWKDGKLLLVERRKPPFGLAPPSGHVGDRASFEEAARAELKEEVGLEALELRLVAQADRDNPCRRRGGSWHHWKIYEVQHAGTLQPSTSETKRAGWFSRADLSHLASKTTRYLEGNITEQDWEKDPGLEPVWHNWL